MTKTAPHENPLVPNDKLKQIYKAMTGARVLDEWLSRGSKARRLFASTRGEEACRVGTAIDLEVGDLVSDSHPALTMEFIAGVRLEILARAAASQKLPHAESSGIVMPWIDDAESRLRIAMGSALALKMAKAAKIVVAYAYQGDLKAGAWQQVLTQASSLELPLIVVILPSRAKDGARLPAKARRCGVPCIAADAEDVVALYRVMQESIGRARNGGGAVLIECRAFRLEGSTKKVAADPVSYLRKFMLERKVCTEGWAQRVEEAFHARLKRVTPSVKRT